MKLLRNPVVVGLLVVAAVALVAKSLWPMFNRGGGARVIRVAPPAAPAKPAKPAAPTAKPAVTETQKETTAEAAPALRGPISDVDWARVRTNATQWLESPGRDPFQVRDWAGGQVPGSTNPPASAFLTLNGIWRQTGSTLAVINSIVLGEGDEILQFKIQSIEPDRVWVYGPSGVEVLPFKPIGSEDATTEPNAAGKKPPAPKPGAPPPTLR